MSHDSIRMSRARLFMLIDAFESDNRALVDRCLLDHQTPEEVFSTAELRDATWRQENEEDGTEQPLVNFLDLKPAFDALARGKPQLPSQLRDHVAISSSAVATLVPIRNRVMHGRPLRSDDPSTATTVLNGFPSIYWPNTSRVLDRLRLDPTWEPLITRQPVPHEPTLHNLPEPDYDETTFIGRQKESDKLLGMLLSRRHAVVTLTGEGGIGKTALAVDIAYRILDSPENPYEAILWVSLKTEQLTAQGVQELTNAVTEVNSTIDSLAQSIDSGFSGTLEELSEALAGVTALLIIDNLETVNGEEILAMIDELPTSVHYLFTSRVGLGQLERRLPLPPLSTDEAKLLFRKFASSRQQRNLTQLSETAISHVVEELRRSPLAIKWYVLSSEAGRVPLDVLRDQEVLLKFCVQNVYENLSDTSRAILSVLRALDRSIGFEEFSILTEMGIDDLRSSTQELARGALVFVEASTVGAVASRLALTPTARAFLARPDHSGAFIREVLKRERSFKSAAESRVSAPRGIDRSRYAGRDETDNASLFSIKNALASSRVGRYEEALDTLSRAKSFNPEFSELYRASGYIESLQRRFESAHSDYKAAVEFASGSETVAVSNYVLADLLATKLRSSHLAVEYAQTSLEAKPCGDTSYLMGKVLVWSGDYVAGQRHLEDARDALQGQPRLRASTLLADSWARWAQQSLKDFENSEAIRQAQAGFHLATVESKDHPHDQRLHDVMADCLTAMLKACTRKSSLVQGEELRMLDRMLQGSSVWAPRASTRKIGYLRDALTHAQSSLHGNPAQKKQFDELLLAIN